MDITVIDAFASHIFCSVLTEDFSYLSKCKSELEYKDIIMPGDAKSSGTICQTILDKFDREKNILTKHFNHLNDEKLKYISTKFKISTSWITKTPPGGYSKYHNHGNSFMSGILYFDEYDNSSSPLELGSFNLPSNTFRILPDEFNQYNSSDYKLYPQKNLLVFFPSYLYHKIGYNNSSQDRYSLAFNVVPCGTIGTEDSTIQLP